MRFTKEQRFLCSRIAILTASVGAAVSAVAVFKGFPFWYGGFALFFWLALGLLNLSQKSSLWLLLKQPRLFCAFYGALAVIFYLADQFGLNAHLWFYPFYRGGGFLWVWLVLYPFGALSLLEFIYFLNGHIGEPLRFIELPVTARHDFFGVSEQMLFLLMIFVIVAGAIPFGWKIALLLVAAIVSLWIVAALIKTRLHIRNPAHWTLIISLTAALAALSRELPTIARDWIYLEPPFLNYVLLGIPLFAWIGWFWFILVPLRLWIFLAPHQKAK